jgi:phage terminase small subunit
MKKLSPRQRLFVHEYVIDLNATKAAERCGYSKKTARQQGHRLLTKAYIKKAVKALLDKRTSKLVMSREEILEELSILGRSDLKHYFDIDEGGEIRAKPFDQMPKDTSRALESIKETRTIRESSDGKETNVVTDKIEFATHSKLGALKLLGQHEGLFPTKIEGDLTIRAKLSLSDFKKSTKAIQDAEGGQS